MPCNQITQILHTYIIMPLSIYNDLPGNPVEVCMHVSNTSMFKMLNIYYCLFGTQYAYTYICIYIFTYIWTTSVDHSRPTVDLPVYHLFSCFNNFVCIMAARISARRRYLYLFNISHFALAIFVFLWNFCSMIAKCEQQQTNTNLYVLVCKQVNSEISCWEFQAKGSRCSSRVWRVEEVCLGPINKLWK